jgi:putative membrane protein insertion efficiency factor
VGKINFILRKIIIALVSCYRVLISPILGNHCRFYPTCSSYAISAIEQYGIIKGVYLTTRRLLRCHPWHQGGYDPVPEDKLKG